MAASIMEGRIAIIVDGGCCCIDNPGFFCYSRLSYGISHTPAAVSHDGICCSTWFGWGDLVLHVDFDSFGKHSLVWYPLFDSIRTVAETGCKGYPIPVSSLANKRGSFLFPQKEVVIERWTDSA